MAGVGDGVTERVLLVEDNEIDRMVAVAFLGRLGYRTETAADGDRALALLAAGSYGAVLLDCRLPGRDGFEVVAELRRREGTGRRTPVLALSAAATAEAERCRAAGMDDVLAKPVTLDVLGTALARWLRPAGATPAPSGGTAPTSPPGVPPSGLDPARLAELRDPDPAGYAELMTDLARSFAVRGTELLGRLAAAVHRGDAPAAALEAHALKGSAGNLGAARLAALAAEVETLTRQGELAGTPELLRGMADEVGHVRRALDDLVRPGA
jgi:CheY-like chemotaxis protein/HPt (histidine-containing phosphotransfer) domain-containing protein